MPEASDTGSLPVWSLDSVYTGFDDPAYGNDTAELKNGIQEILSFLKSGKQQNDPSVWLKEVITRYNRLSDLMENLESFAYTRFSTDTRDQTAVNQLNAMEALAVPMKQAEVLFRNALAEIREQIPGILERDENLREYGFFLKEELLFQEKQMSPEEEDLAADLSRAGGEAWGRLQESISSTLSMPWDEESGERKTVVQLRALAFHPDRAVRERAYRKELEAWQQVEIPLAFALNGVKGFSHTLNSRRGFESTLERSVLQSRISRKTLDSLIQVMTESLPIFRSYLKTKASLLGLKQLSFYDIFAPVRDSEAGKDGENKVWSFEEAREFIVRQFRGFSDDLADFAGSAFDQQWIDARPRDGKVGGAYCISFPLPGESRILCNFDGSFSSLTTVAHELGHAYHHHVLKDETAILRGYPMTLAETASIFSESIVFHGALDAAPESERTSLVEAFLADTTQVIVDILSRFIFENAVMDTRKDRELSPAEFCDLMLKAQKETYGDALNPEELHPYMWAVKGHYYRQNLAFYNFPYAFGQLFGLGLFARFSREGSDFARVYRDLLIRTGRASANEVTREAGFDIETAEFWRAGIDMVRKHVETLAARAGTAG